MVRARVLSSALALVTVGLAGCPKKTEPAKVSVSIRVSPQNAQLRLDGQAIVNPYLAERPRDSEGHMLFVEAPGFASYKARVQFDKDVKLDIALERDEAEAPADAAAKPPAP